MHDGSNYSLRVKRNKDNFQGDRFIPLRSGEHESQAQGDNGCTSNYQLQFQHEEDMLRCQTQIRRSKKRHEFKSKTKRSGEAQGVDNHYDPLMSPSFDNDFLLGDAYGARGSANEDAQESDKSPSNQSNTNSKGSPNEEKNK